jgi:arsenical pump membrane protein
VLSHRIVLDAVSQVWPPFVLVAGLLLIGQAASDEGLFESLGARIASLPLSPRALLVALLCLVAVVTAVLNLDTSVVFLTPVLVHAARRRRLDERPFLYGCVFMSNSASLLLPGSNLTNLLVLHTHPVTGSAFAVRMLPAWLSACTLTTALLVIAFPLHSRDQHTTAAPSLPLGLATFAILAAAALVVALPNAAVPVLALGIAIVAHRRLRPRLDLRALVLLFALTVAVGVIARSWHQPTALIAGLGSWPTAGLAALASILLNNLPASVLLSAHTPPHPVALLLGLDLGPNLAATGSLSALLWLRAAQRVDAHPSLRTYTLLGAVIVPLTLASALALQRS